MHTPVYLEETITALDPKKDGAYIDATLGEGGHTDEIAKHAGKVLALDQDEEQVKKYRRRALKNVTAIQGNFADLAKIATENGYMPADGILFDLGISYEQLKHKNIGLSFRNISEPLDMRLSPAAEVTAAEILNKYSEDELYGVFAKYGEDVNARAVARQCIYWRKEYLFAEVGDFVDVIDKAIQQNPQKSYARLFQALRIAVNDEFESLRKGLAAAMDTLSPGGRLVVITFHSLEDRIVKRFIGTESARIEKSYKVIKKNAAKFERSALLRVIIKK